MVERVFRKLGRRSAGLGIGSLLLGAKASAAPLDLPPVNPEHLPPTIKPGHDVVCLMGGALIGSYIKMVSDIASVFASQSPDAPRVLPVVSSGGLQVTYDLVEQDFIEGAVVSGVTLDVARRGGWIPDMAQRLYYVTQLYFEETHILSTQLVDNIYSLNGLTVNTGPLGGGTDVIARRMFELLAIQPRYDNRPIQQALRGVRAGDPAAVVFIAGKPVDVFNDIQIPGSLRFVPIPGDDKAKHWLAPWFRPALLTNADYPRLIPPSTNVPTVASAVFLATPALPKGSPRQRLISAMTSALLENLLTLQNGPYEPKWREANVLELLPNFSRAPEVVDWFTRSNTTGQ
jgi:uncharacterized protein